MKKILYGMSMILIVNCVQGMNTRVSSVRSSSTRATTARTITTRTAMDRVARGRIVPERVSEKTTMVDNANIARMALRHKVEEEEFGGDRKRLICVREQHAHELHAQAVSFESYREYGDIQRTVEKYIAKGYLLRDLTISILGGNRVVSVKK